MEIKSKSEKETEKIAESLAKTLKAGDIVALFGDLGAGKTVFAKGFARGLGIKKRIVSPTFTLVRSYKANGITFHHHDLYRGQKLQDFGSLGLAELFSQGSIVFIEWAQKIKKELPKKRIDIKIVYIDEKTRLIKIEKKS